AAPRRLDIFGHAAMRDCEVKLLAYLIGDGALTKTNPEFTNGNTRLQDDFQQAVEQFGAVKVRREDSGGTRTPTFSVAGDPEFIARGRQQFAGRLRSAMRRRACSARAVALAVGVTPGAVCYWGQGFCVPKEEVFRKLCEVLNVASEELVPDGYAGISR